MAAYGSGSVKYKSELDRPSYKLHPHVGVDDLVKSRHEQMG